jgi:NAD(P)-dependent dehydrogenase (short-subunit alcohol dehydrogenase family)
MRQNEARRGDDHGTSCTRHRRQPRHRRSDFEGVEGGRLQVAATYAGNDEKAAAFTEATGIKTYKWNVADYEAARPASRRSRPISGPIDVVVANAGITRDGLFHKMTPEQWKEVIDTNLTGVFNTVHPVWPGMRERKFGRIIVISSINGQKGQAGQTNYAADQGGRPRHHQERWRRKGAGRASPPTRSARAISAPRWCARSTRRC